MAKFRKKPVVIEAIEFTDRMYNAVDPCPEGVEYVTAKGEVAPSHIIKTLEGSMKVSVGDFIITGVKGERYPCKPDIFKATYNPAEAPEVEAPNPDQEGKSCGIGWAVKQMQNGQKVRRRGWNGKGMFIVIDKLPNLEPYVTLWTAQKVFQPGWLASQPDLLGMDWEIAD